MNRDVKDETRPAKVPERRQPKTLLDQPSPSGSMQKWVTKGKSWFTEQKTEKENLDSSHAETATLMKKYFQRAKRRKRWIKISGICLVVVVLIGGIGVWYGEKNYSFKLAIFKGVSTFWSIHVEPDMVNIPAGSFRQGNINNEEFPNELPARNVTVKQFAIGRFEVTFEEYDRFAIATGRPMPRDEGWGRGARPVMNVSWEDAQDYADWLSQVSGTRYRLPTETEWEYAARNRGKAETWSGTSQETELVEYAWFSVNSAGRTQPVGTKQPNKLGLYDMNGNVWEWVQDCWHEDYQGGPSDGSAWLNGENCGVRVRRGGGWTDPPLSLRSSMRNWYSADTKSILIGFRLAQDIS